MAQTAIQKAIEQLQKLQDDTGSSEAFEIKILTDLLPYERETIEAAYRQGDDDCGSCEFGGVADFLNEQDYFTKTYQND